MCPIKFKVLKTAVYVLALCILNKTRVCRLLYLQVMRRLIHPRPTQPDQLPASLPEDVQLVVEVLVIVGGREDVAEGRVAEEAIAAVELQFAVAFSHLDCV